MKIAVYAISCNEAKHVERFLDSVMDADEVVILDTGSTDGTVYLVNNWVDKHPDYNSMLSPRVHTPQVLLNPFRFDLARNIALAHVSRDVDLCLMLDLDEVMAPGWREALERAANGKGYIPGHVRFEYTLVASHLEDGSDGVVLKRQNCHARFGYLWQGAAHEGLVYVGEGEERIVPCDMVTHHWPDQTKSRASYLPLLEMAQREDPHNPRFLHYLGREYLYRGMHDKAFAMLQAHLAEPTSTWNAERAESYRLIAQMSEGENKIWWLQKAIAEDPYRRDQWVDLAYAYDATGFQDGVRYAVRQAWAIQDRGAGYMTYPFSWDEDELNRLWERATCASS